MSTGAAFVPAAEKPTGTFDGAGPVSGAADLAEVLGAGEVDPFGAAVAAAGLGLDALAFVSDPVGEALQAGVGWLMEHVAFLREPLDWLAGDPAQILARAEDWHTGARTLAAEALERADPGLDGWSGAAARAALLAAGREAEALAGLSASCDEIAELLVGTAGLIGVERSLIRDTIAEFVARAIEWAVTAMVTGGWALVAAVPAVVLAAVRSAARVIGRIERLAAVLEEAAATVGRVAARAGTLVGSFPGTGAAELGSLLRDTAVESGKEQAKAGATLRSWEQGPGVP